MPDEEDNREQDKRPRLIGHRPCTGSRLGGRLAAAGAGGRETGDRSHPAADAPTRDQLVAASVTRHKTQGADSPPLKRGTEVGAGESRSPVSAFAEATADREALAEAVRLARWRWPRGGQAASHPRAGIASGAAATPLDDSRALEGDSPLLGWTRVPGGARVRQAEHRAKQETRPERFCRASSVPAFWLL